MSSIRGILSSDSCKNAYVCSTSKTTRSYFSWLISWCWGNLWIAPGSSFGGCVHPRIEIITWYNETEPGRSFLVMNFMGVLSLKFLINTMCCRLEPRHVTQRLRNSYESVNIYFMGSAFYAIVMLLA